MDRLPNIAGVEDFQTWRSSPDRWLPIIRRIASNAHVDVERPRPFADGTNLVVDLNGSTVLKLFPPIYASQFESERTALRLLSGRLSVPIPSVSAEGQEAGWSWLMMTKLSGTVGAQAWPMLNEDERVHILGQIGKTIAEVQAIAPEDLVAVTPDWHKFIGRQSANCRERHRSHGLPIRFLEDLTTLINDAPSVLPRDIKPVILTGEWILENLLLSQTPDGWRLAAVIDFGDVITGWGEYDLLGPSTFMCAGKPDRIKSLLNGYGKTSSEYDAAMKRRLFTLMVLHRASDLRKISIAGWANKIDKLHDLEDIVWPSLR